MPNYNKGAYVAEAVESVLSQTFSDLELIVVDDASTDGSYAAIGREAARDPRVKPLRLGSHSGAAAARNRGLVISTGEYIALLDSDDSYDAKKIEFQLEALNGSPGPSIVYSDWTRMDGTGRPLPPFKRDHLRRSGMVFGDLLVDSLAINSTIMGPKACFEEVGLYDESLAWGEDQDMVLRLARRYPFLYVDRPLYSYRVFEGNSFVTVPKRQRLYWKSVVLERHMKGNWKMLDEHTRRRAKRRLLGYYSASGRHTRLFAEGIRSFDGLVFLARMLRRAVRRAVHD